MRSILIRITLSFALLSVTQCECVAQSVTAYLNAEQRKSSPGNTTYYIDPVKGSDASSGKSPEKAWQSFAPANRYMFNAGDRLMIIRPGHFYNSLVLVAKGTKKRPVKVTFARGTYHFYDSQALKKTLHISNTNDVPDGFKAIAIYIANTRHLVLQSKGAKIILHARMVETCIDESENVTVNGLSYDYNTPTVSEFKVINVRDNYAELDVNHFSHFVVNDSTLYWKGDGWQYKSSWYWQEFNPANGYLTRKGLALEKAKFADLGNNRIGVHFASNLGFKQGYIYQTRDVKRDCAGFFFRRSKDIQLRNIRVYFMHGMGVVSQFCENILMDSVVVKPDPATGRTCAAWADILHFSSCKGQISVKNSYLSAANDDAVNVHGVHLRIIDKLSPNKLMVRFMHGQTFGFNPYNVGDSIALIHGKSLLPFGRNVVLKSEMMDDKNVLLTLKDTVNNTLASDDAIENITWTPQLHVSNTTITSIPTRGILVTTRKKAMIANNRFIGTSSSAILVEDDAEGWYESGQVADLTIRNNQFIKCGEAVISIHPENVRNYGPVHHHVNIYSNTFNLSGSKALYAKSTSDIRFNHNTIQVPEGFDEKLLTVFEDCNNIDVANNRIKK